MPGRQQVGSRSAQCLPLVGEEVQGKTGVELGIVDPPALESAVLIVFDQVVIRIAGKREGAETQRVHRGQSQQPQVGLRRFEVRQVESDQVVTENERRAFGKLVELREGRRRSTAGIPLTGIAAHCAKGANAAVFLASLKVNRETAGLEGLVLRRCRSGYLCFGKWWVTTRIECVWHFALRNSRWRPKQPMKALVTRGNSLSIPWIKSLLG